MICRRLDAARCFVLSPPFQCAVQFSVAVLVVGLFVFVRPLTFPWSCLSAVMLAVALAVLSPDNHIGTRLQASAVELGGLVCGTLLGGVVLTLSRLAAPASCTSLVGCHAHTAALCGLGVLGLAPVVANRAAVGAPYPSHLWLGGLLGAIGYGIVVIAGQFHMDYVVIWQQVVGNLLAMSVLGTGTCALVSVLVLPSLALDEMRADTAAAIRGVGHAASRIASRALAPADGPAPEFEATSAPEAPTARKSGPLARFQAASTGHSLEQPESRLSLHVRWQGALGPAADRHGPSDLPPIREAQLASNGSLERERTQQEAQGGPVHSHPLGEQAPGLHHQRGRHRPAGPLYRQHHLYQFGLQVEGLRTSPPQSQTEIAVGAAAGTGQSAAAGAAVPGSRSDGAPQDGPQLGPQLPAHLPLRPYSPRARHLAGPPLQPVTSRRVPGVASCPALDQLDGAPVAADAGPAPGNERGSENGSRRNSGYGYGYASSASQSSDDEHHVWRAPTDPDRLDFEDVMEDEDAFLRLLREATAPQVPPDPKEAAAARRPPPPVAPPGGIRPSPSVFDMLRLPTGASSSAASSHKVTKREPSDPNRRRAKAAPASQHAKPQGEAVSAAAAAAAATAVSGPGAGPSTAQSGGGLSGGAAVAWAPVSAIRPLLARAKACAAAAALEPPWMCSGPADLAAWGRVLAGCDVLVDRVSALECLQELGQGGALLNEANVAALLGMNFLAPYRRVYGEVAASCAAMSIAIAECCEGRPRDKAFAAVGGWEATKQRLRGVAREVLSGYWSRVRGAGERSANGGGGGGGGGGGAGEGEGLPQAGPSPALHHQHHDHLQHLYDVGPSKRLRRQLRAGRIPMLGLHQSRAMNFLWTVTEGIVNSMDELEAAVRGALGGKADAAHETKCAAPGDRGPVGEDAGADGSSNTAARDGGGGNPEGGRGEKGTVSNSDSSQTGAGGGDCAAGTDGSARGTPSRPVVLVVTGPDTAQASRDPSSTGAEKAGWRAWAVQEMLGPLVRLWRWQRGEWDWAWRVVQLSAGLPMMINTVTISVDNLRLLVGCGGPRGRAALLSSRKFQFGVKYWVASSFMLCLLLGLAARPDGALLRKYSLLYAFLATSVSMTDRVESTLSRVALRAGGTVLGGSLGLAVMMAPRLNHSPAGIMAIVCAVTFLTGCMSAHRLVYGFVLALVTLQSMVLCQYGTSCCGTAVDTAELFVARVVSVLVGCTLPVLVTQAVLPWFTSDWALETLAGSLMAASDLVWQLYRHYYQEHQKAFVASRGLAAAVELLRQHGLEWEAGQLEREERERRDREKEEEGQAAANGEAHRDGATADGARTDALVSQRPADGLEDQHQEQQGQVQTQGGGVAAGGKVVLVATGAGSPTTDGRNQQLGEELALVEAQTDGLRAAPREGDGSGGGGPARAQGEGQEQGASLAAKEVSLQTHVSGPLVAVQTSLMKDTAVWTRGIYATPMIVSATLRCCLVLADRLAALQLVVVDTPPPVYGRLSGWAFSGLVLPLHRQTMLLLSSLDRVVVATALLMDPDGGYRLARRWGAGGEAGPPEGQLPEAEGGASSQQSPGPLQEVITELEERRLQVRQTVHDMRRSFHAGVRALAAGSQHLAAATHPDDTVRFHAFMFALVQVLDKATAAARTVMQISRGRVRRAGAWFAWSRG